MAGLSRGGAIAAMAAAMMAVAGGGNAADALSYNNILGKWCGTQSNYAFTRDKLTVTNLPSNEVVSFKINSFDFSDSTVIVHYLAAAGRGDTAGGQPFRVTFGDFSADGQTMAQVPSEVGPRRPFHRC